MTADRVAVEVGEDLTFTEVKEERAKKPAVFSTEIQLLGSRHEKPHTIKNREESLQRTVIEDG